MEGSLAILVSGSIPCVLFEDEHLLAVEKPCGMNTHSPSPFAGEGIYEWLKNREPRWAKLATIHRLDKETSGVMLFSKTSLANRSLTDQFASRKVAKTYHFLSAKKADREQFAAKGFISRLGDRYIQKSAGQKTEFAETHFKLLGKHNQFFLYEASPKTGRTHQIRVQAAAEQLPVAGDKIYGGPLFPRLALHAHQLGFHHPESGEWLEIKASIDWEAAPFLELRRKLISPGDTTVCRLVHGASDQQPGLYLEKWGDFLLAMADGGLSSAQKIAATKLAGEGKATGVYWKNLRKDVRAAGLEESAPQLLLGGEAPEFFTVMENGVKFRISFRQGYSVGLFIDQRENRRRLMSNYVAPDFTLFPEGLGGKSILNTFSYTCGFSVCAAMAGAQATSLDLSKKYLDWGRENFELNGLNPRDHDFIFGDVLDWFSRFRKKGRMFDLILLDPPTFSKSRESGNFSAEKDYQKLARAAFDILAPGGIVFASTNAARFAPEDFVKQIQTAAIAAGKKPAIMEYFPQPFDFPISKAEPGYLKTVWVQT